MTRRRRTLLLLALLAAVVALALYRLPFWSASLLAERLSAGLNRPVTVAEIRLHALPFEAEVLGLEVGGMRPGDPPFAEIPRLSLVPSLGSIFGPRLVLSRLRLEGMKLRVHALPDAEGGGDDIPRGGGGKGGGGGELRIRRLTIEGGEFLLDHDRVPLQLDLPDVRLRLAQRRGGIMGGSLAFGPGTLQLSANPPFPLGAELELVVEGSLITLEKGRIRSSSGRTDLAATGKIKIAHDPIGEFQLEGPVDLDELERHVMQTGFGIKGDARFKGVLSVNGPRLRVQGRMGGTNGVYDGVPVPEFDGELSWNEHGVTLTGLELKALGGNGTLNLNVPSDSGALAKLDARLGGVDAEGLIMPIFDIGAAGLAAAANGELAIAWPKGRIRALSGRIAVELEAKDDGRTPLRGRFEWRAEKGTQLVEKAELRTPSTNLRLEGRIEIDDRSDLAVDGESTDLAATDDLGRRLRRALGAGDPQLAGFSGAGSFRGRWKGTLQVPVYEGRFSGNDVGYLGVVWGKAEWAGVADPYEVRSR